VTAAEDAWDGGVGRHGPWAVVVPEPELDPSTAPTLRKVLDDLHDRGEDHIAVDWRPVSFFDSSAIGVLMGAHKRLRGDGGALAVICPAGQERRLFDLMALDKVLMFVENEESLPA
jgi:anti-sigma B factor antagonist